MLVTTEEKSLSEEEDLLKINVAQEENYYTYITFEYHDSIHILRYTYIIIQALTATASSQWGREGGGVKGSRISKTWS